MKTFQSLLFIGFVAILVQEAISCSVQSVCESDELQSQIQQAGNKMVMIDFYADWCGPCKSIAPTVDALATKYCDSLVVLKVNVDRCSELTDDFGVTSMPTFVFVKNGQSVQTVKGANARALEAVITSV